MRNYITGICGMVGSHLAEYLLECGDEVVGLCRWRSPRENIAGIINDIELVECDLLDATGMVRTIEKVQPDKIFHLAAASYVQTSYNSPSHTLQTNVLGTLNLLEALRVTGFKGRCHFCGSSEEFGQPLPHEVPMSEKNPIRPVSPYGVSKAAGSMLCYEYHLAHGLYIVRTRAFNHGGSRRGDVFFESAFAKQVAAIKLGMKEPVVRVGNLASVRTMCHVKDMVRAYYLALEKGVPGEVYNIGATKTVTVGEVLDYLLKVSGVDAEVVVDESLLRPVDVTLQLPDVSRFHTLTGWEPEIPMFQVFDDLLAFWEEQLTLYPWKLKSVEK